MHLVQPHLVPEQEPVSLGAMIYNTRSSFLLQQLGGPQASSLLPVAQTGQLRLDPSSLILGFKAEDSKLLIPTPERARPQARAREEKENPGPGLRFPNPHKRSRS